MIDALWITMVGMGLVFCAILLLWGLMALLVRLTQEPSPPVSQESVLLQPVLEGTAVDQDRTMDHKRLAAAAAVVAALALQQEGRKKTAGMMSSFDQPASAWQTANRASQISQRINAFRKKGAQ